MPLNWRGICAQVEKTFRFMSLRTKFIPHVPSPFLNRNAENGMAISAIQYSSVTVTAENHLLSQFSLGMVQLPTTFNAASIWAPPALRPNRNPFVFLLMGSTITEKPSPFQKG